MVSILKFKGKSKSKNAMIDPHNPARQDSWGTEMGIQEADWVM